MTMIVVKCMDLKVGDVIYRCGEIDKIDEMIIWSTQHEVMAPPFDTGVSTSPAAGNMVELKSRALGEVKIWDGTRYTGQFFYVDRAGAPQVKSKSKSWNGKCPSCGKGIYVGFITTEHEGGPCR